MPKKDKPPKFVNLILFTNDEDENGFDKGVVSMSRKDIEKILTKMQLVTELKRKNKELRWLVFPDMHAAYVKDADAGRLGDDKFGIDEPIFGDESLSVKACDDGDSVSVDAPEQFISNDTLYFTVYPDGRMYRVECDEISKKDLNKWLKVLKGEVKA